MNYVVVLYQPYHLCNGALNYSRLSQHLESVKKQLVAPCAAAWQGMRIHRFEVAEVELAERMNTKHKTDRQANHHYKGHFDRNFPGQVKGRHPLPSPQQSIALHDFVPSWAVVIWRSKLLRTMPTACRTTVVVYYSIRPRAVKIYIYVPLVVTGHKRYESLVGRWLHGQNVDKMQAMIYQRSRIQGSGN